MEWGKLVTRFLTLVRHVSMRLAIEALKAIKSHNIDSLPMLT